MRPRTTDDEAAIAVVKRLDWVRSVKRAGDHLAIDMPVERGPELAAALAARAIFPEELTPPLPTVHHVCERV